jgi:hypothetical protein
VGGAAAPTIGRVTLTRQSHRDKDGEAVTRQRNGTAVLVHVVSFSFCNAFLCVSSVELLRFCTAGFYLLAKPNKKKVFSQFTCLSQMSTPSVNYQSHLSCR